MQNLPTAPTDSPRGAPHLVPEGCVAPAPVVDVVVPVFDEERALGPGVRRLHTFLTDSFPFSWRITIVDNASTDATWAEASALARDLVGVRAVHLDRKGRGLALRRAWSESDAEVVAYMDVDLSTDLDALLPLVAPLVSGHSDLAIGSRLAPGSHVARHPKREVISRAYNLILRTLLATRVRDAQCGFKAVRATVARRILPAVEDDGWFFDTELLLLAERNGLRIHEVPVDWIDDTDSRVHVVSTAVGDLKGAARMALRFATGRGRIDLGSAGRVPLTDDFGRRFVSFASIGTASTAVSLALFLSTRATIGPIAANLVAVTATFVANAWANAALHGAAAATVVGADVRRLRGIDSRDQCSSRTRRRDHLERVGTDRRARRDVVARGRSALRRDRERPVTTIPIRLLGARRLGARRTIVQRMSRCLLVSVGTTLLSAAVLVVLALGLGVPAGSANVVAVLCGVGPSYFANRNWVWGRSGRGNIVSEVLPFWALSGGRLVVSTVAVSTVGSAAANWSTTARAIAFPVANLSTFAALWLVQFALLDQVLFRVVPNGSSASTSPDDLPAKEYSA